LSYNLQPKKDDCIVYYHAFMADRSGACQLLWRFSDLMFLL